MAGNLRKLLKAEYDIAVRVYKDSLPWNKINLSPRLGLNNRAYVMGRCIHVGTAGYQQGMQSGSRASTLIHELCHVWQYEHRGWSGSYLCDAAYANITHGTKAYNAGTDKNPFDIKRAWDDYGAEQQAEIAKYWYNAGCDPADDLFHYIRDNIWQKHISPDDNRWHRIPSGL
jgi:hypothetical protein